MREETNRDACYCCGGPSFWASHLPRVAEMWRPFCGWACWRRHRDGLCDCPPERHDEARAERMRETCDL